MQTTFTPEALAQIVAELSRVNAAHDALFPGDFVERQPVHTVYGGAHLFKPETPTRLGSLALDTIRNYASGFFLVRRMRRIAKRRAREQGLGAHRRKARRKNPSRTSASILRTVTATGPMPKKMVMRFPPRRPPFARPTMPGFPAIHRDSNQEFHGSLASASHPHAGSVPYGIARRRRARSSKFRDHAAQGDLAGTGHGAGAASRNFRGSPQNRAWNDQDRSHDRDSAIDRRCVGNLAHSQAAGRRRRPLPRPALRTVRLHGELQHRLSGSWLSPSGLRFRQDRRCRSARPAGA